MSSSEDSDDEADTEKDEDGPEDSISEGERTTTPPVPSISPMHGLHRLHRAVSLDEYSMTLVMSIVDGDSFSPIESNQSLMDMTNSRPSSPILPHAYTTPISPMTPITPMNPISPQWAAISDRIPVTRSGRANSGHSVFSMHSAHSAHSTYSVHSALNDNIHPKHSCTMSLPSVPMIYAEAAEPMDDHRSVCSDHRSDRKSDFPRNEHRDSIPQETPLFLPEILSSQPMDNTTFYQWAGSTAPPPMGHHVNYEANSMQHRMDRMDSSMNRSGNHGVNHVVNHVESHGGSHRGSVPIDVAQDVRSDPELTVSDGDIQDLEDDVFVDRYTTPSPTDPDKFENAFDLVVPIPRSYSVPPQMPCAMHKSMSYSGPYTTSGLPSGLNRSMSTASPLVSPFHTLPTTHMGLTSSTGTAGSNLFRQHTSRSWQDEELDHLELEMAQQLLSLKQAGSQSVDTGADTFKKMTPLPSMTTMRPVIESGSNTMTRNSFAQMDNRQMDSRTMDSRTLDNRQMDDTLSGINAFDISTGDESDNGAESGNAADWSPVETVEYTVAGAFETQREMDAMRKQMLHLAAMEMVSSAGTNNTQRL